MTEDNHSPIDWSKDEKFMEMIEPIIDQIRKIDDEVRNFFSNFPKTSIFKVPSKLAVRDVNIPHFVSIGPIHAGVADLAMEEIKLRYSMDFFCRSKNPAGFVKECGEAIVNLQKLAREYYTHDLEKFDKYKLMKILLVDGCFLLELFLRHSKEEIRGIDVETFTGNYIRVADLVLGNPWMHSAVCQDLALLENQIPLVVLETLLSKVKPYLRSRNYGVQEYTLRFFSSDLHACMEISIGMDGLNPIPCEEPRHILELLHKRLLPPMFSREVGGKYGLLYGATKLQESGVNIKKNIDLSNENDYFNSNLLKIEFDISKGILKVPQFWIGGTTSLIIKNLVAFEQFNLGHGYHSHHVTAYVIFMKSLITSEHDLELLKRKGIIKTHPGSNSIENVMEFFNDCSAGVVLKDFYFSHVCVNVEVYSKNWILWTFNSYVTCFKSRGRKYGYMITAYFAGTIFLLLACLQTFYTVYPYYRK